MLFLRKLFFWVLAFCLIEAASAHDLDSVLEKNISFIENIGQWEDEVLFKLAYQNSTLFFERHGVTHVLIDPKGLEEIRNSKFTRKPVSPTLNAHAYRLSFRDALPSPKINKYHKKSYYHNYYLGNDPTRWKSEVPLYQAIEYQELYRGINLRYFEQEYLLKYEFEIAPYADPGQIKMVYEGDVKLSIKGGMLFIKTSVGEVREMQPYAYQIDNQGNKKEISCRFNLQRNSVTFELGDYDPAQKLIIDPTLIFSTYTGSTADNWGFTATYDLDGNMYGAGIANNTGYPLSLGAYQNFYAGYWDIAISKFNPTGTQLLFSTYLGGAMSEMPHSLVANHNKELYLFGTTGSSNFPITSQAYQPVFNGGNNCTTTNAINFPQGTDIVIVKFNQSGTQLLASTYLGGTGNDGLNLADVLVKNYADEVRGEIILDDQSNLYLTSSTLSADFPVTTGVPFSGVQAAILCKLNHNLSSLIWSNYFGGDGSNYSVAGYSLAFGPNNSVFITGGTNSPTLAGTAQGVQTTYGGGVTDGYLARFDAQGENLLGFTYCGSDVYDQSYLVKTDRYYYPHIVGQTSAPMYSFYQNATWHFGMGQFISKYTPTLDSIVWSTEFGNNLAGPDISPTALLVDVCNRIYISGWGGNRINGFGGTSGLPITSDAIQPTTDNNDYYLMCIADDASALLYGTYFGSSQFMPAEHVDGGTSRFDKQGRIYQAVCAGCGGSSSFPTTPGAYSQTNNSSNCNLAVFKIDFEIPAVISEFDMPNTVCAPATIQFTNNSLTLGPNTNFFWDFGDGTTSTSFQPDHTYSQPGTYQITLIVQDLSSCNLADTITKSVLVLSNSSQYFPNLFSCAGDPVQIGLPPAAEGTVTYTWTPTTGLSNSSISNPYASPTNTTTYQLLISDGTCSDTIYQTVEVVEIDIDLPPQIVICEGEDLLFTPTINATHSNLLYYWSNSPNFTTFLNNDFSDPTLQISSSWGSGVLYLKVVMEPCEVIASVPFTVSTVEYIDPEQFVSCFNENVELQLEIITPNCTYQWAPEEYIISGGNSANPVVNPPTLTTFYVTITNSDGCTAVVSVEVAKQSGTFPFPLEAWCDDTDIFLGESTFLESTNYTDNQYTYSWTPSESLSSPHTPTTTASPEVTTLYTIEVTDHFGCTKSDTITVFVTERICDEPYVYVPNAFTPNNDGKNDILFVRSDILEEFVLRIYDRWGELIFETNSLDKGWDGTYKNEPCMPGVYDYFLEGYCNNKKEILKKGNITLIR